MDRRAFLKVVTAGAVTALALPETVFALDDMGSQVSHDASDVKDQISKIRFFDHHFPDDIRLNAEQMLILASVVGRLKRVESAVGYANFSLLSFDDAVRVAAGSLRVGEFTAQEKEFIDGTFHRAASDYGFFGEKVLAELTTRIPAKEMIKMPATGQYLYRGDSHLLYEKIVKDVGPTIVLTSGVRGIVKQIYLFLAKAVQSEGNLSMASRSLAPPGHSFHGVGDFDVGRRGLGSRNFTEAFAKTQEFKRLTDLGYIHIRYHESNEFGVRFEPWHVKVVG